eukprot:gb/GECG01003140.1/.p1 GENE.gb/GECG01003140.1/~~gb/GECG01003140.1/.p1  ORF type:complete len:362 (+),score=49.52 gb/GECG01003140.1/:1-1086(+)
MKLKHLESMLQEIDGFEEPQVHLEQYPTPIHLAAQIALHIRSEQEEKEAAASSSSVGAGAASTEKKYRSDSGKDDKDAEESDGVITAADLGCGTGILSIALVLAGAADKVYAFDCDPLALQTAANNIEEFGLSDQIFLHESDLSLFLDSNDHTTGEVLQMPRVDYVIMNPPFGTRSSGIDMAFVDLGLHMSRTYVYSLHKTSTREVSSPLPQSHFQREHCHTTLSQHVLKHAQKWGGESHVIAELRYDIPKMYAFHASESVDVEVDFIRFTATTETTAGTATLALTSHSLFEETKIPFQDDSERKDRQNISRDLDDGLSSGDFGGIDRRVFRKPKQSTKALSPKKDTPKRRHGPKAKKNKH